MRDLSVLSDIEFEELVADLFAAELGRNVERFARGPDGGVDLRWELDGGKQGIGQCKHFFRSTFPQLLAAARVELRHLRTQKPNRYRFVTSRDLTPGQKDELIKALNPWLGGPDDIFGSRDIPDHPLSSGRTGAPKALALNRYPAVLGHPLGPR